MGRPEIKEKIKQTNLIKYGKEYHTQTETHKEAVVKTCMERYGVKSYLCTDDAKDKNKKYRQEHKAEIIKKQIATNKEIYNTDWPLQNPEVLNKQSETNLELYGVPYHCLTKKCRDASNARSKINQHWQEKLNIDENNTEVRLDNYSYDLKLDEHTLIEIDPTISHNTIFSPFPNRQPIGKEYHQKKSLVAKKYGYNCVHVWDWDDEEKIINLLSTNKTTIYARKLIIKEVPAEDAVMFLNTYHLQSSCAGQLVCLGLYMENSLIQLMTFGKPRYNKKYEWELLRLCTHKNYTVKGGAQKLFHHFLITYHPTFVISYCDAAKFSGQVYSKLGFKLLNLTPNPSLHWYNIKTKRHITDNLLLARGFSQLHKDLTHKKGESNHKLMINAGYYPIYDCGQLTFIWKN